MTKARRGWVFVLVLLLGGGLSLGAEIYATGTQASGENWNQATWAGGQWDNGLVPSSDNTYNTGGYTLRTVDPGSSTFGGASLRIQSGGMLSLKQAHGNTATVNLILDGGTLFAGTGTTGATQQIIRGNVEAASASIVSLADTNNRRISLTNGLLSGSGSITVNGGDNINDILYLESSLTASHAGNWAVNGGRLIATRDDQIGAAARVTLTGASAWLDIRSAQQIGSLAGSGTVQAGVAGVMTLTTGGDNSSTTFSGKLENGTGTLALAKEGAGTLTLSGASTYTGGTAVNAGTLSGTLTATAGGASAFGQAVSTNVITINNGGVLTGTTNNWMDNTAASSGGANAHSLVINAGGKITNGAGVITGMGNVTLNGGTIELNSGYVSGSWNGAYTLMGDITVSGSAVSYITTKVGAGAGANLQMSNGSNGVGGTRTMTVADVTANADSDLIIQGQLINGTMIKKGPGTVELGANAIGSSSAVGWRIDEGTLKTTADNVIGTASVVTGTAAGARLDLGGTTQTVGGLGAAGAGSGFRGTIANGTINLNGKNAYLQNGTFTANLSGGGASRLWIGGDAAATVYLGGINSSTYSDTNSTIIGHATTGGAGTVVLTSAEALGPAGQNSQVFTGTLDLNGLTGITVSSIRLFSGGSSSLANANTAAAAGYGGTVFFNNNAAARVGGAGAMTLSGVLAEGGFTKVGAGTLTLSGASANTFTGTTTVSEGVLRLQKTAGVTALGGNVTITGGRLELGAANQIADTATVSTSGTGVFHSNAQSETIAAMTINSTAASTLANLTVSGLLDIRTGTSHDISSNSSVTVGSMSMSGGSVIRLGANSANSTLTIGSGGLTLADGTIQLGQTGGTPTARVNLLGNLTASGTSAISNPNTTGPRLLDLGGAVRTFTITSGTTTVSPTVQNGGILKAGAGTLVLSGANTYAGPTTVSGGTLQSLTASATGTGAVQVDAGATWDIGFLDYAVAGLSGGGSVVRPAVTTGANGSALISTAKTYVHKLDFGNNTAATVNGVTFQTVATGGTGWSLAGASTPYGESGTPTGYAQLINDFYYNGKPGVLTFSGLTIGQLYEAVLYTQVGTWGSRWQDATFANGSEVHQLLNTDPGTVGYYSYKFAATAPTATITMAPLNTANTFHWFAASLNLMDRPTLTVGDAGDYEFSGVMDGPGAVIKQGGGTQILSGPNTYSGGTIVRQGVLLVNNTQGSGTGTGLVEVEGGATLGGTGAISGPVIVRQDATLAPGAGMASGTLSLLEDSILAIDLTPSLWDSLEVTGGADIAQAILALSPEGNFAIHGGSQYTILSTTQGVNGFFAGLPEGTLFERGGYQFAISYVGNDGNDVVLTAVPEPASLALLGLAATTLGGYLRRRRTR